MSGSQLAAVGASDVVHSITTVGEGGCPPCMTAGLLAAGRSGGGGSGPAGAEAYAGTLYAAGRFAARSQ